MTQSLLFVLLCYVFLLWVLLSILRLEIFWRFPERLPVRVAATCRGVAF